MAQFKYTPIGWLLSSLPLADLISPLSLNIQVWQIIITPQPEFPNATMETKMRGEEK